jgi:hypothetical protein
MMRLGDLPEYAKGTGTDVEQFQSYAEAATQLLDGESTSKRTPFQTSQWFTSAAEQILADVGAAQAAGKNLEGQAAREFQATSADLRILAYLAKYHASRMVAAVWYNVYLQSRDQFALERCLDAESQAIEHWTQLIAAAGDVYPETLKFGVHRVGFSRHWTEELAKLEEGLEQLRKLEGRATLDSATRERMLRRVAASPSDSLRIHLPRPSVAEPGHDLKITAVVESDAGLKWIRLRYRHLTQFEDYRSVDMTRDRGTGSYTARIPGSFIVPEWDVMYFVEALNKGGEGRIAPDLEQEMPYVIVPVAR